MLNFFKKKESVLANNRLEQLILESYEVPAKRGQVFRQMFHFDLLLIGKSNQDDGLSIQKTDIKGLPYAVAFTSLELLKAFSTKQGTETTYVGSNALSILSTLSQASFGLVLNPQTPFEIVITNALVNEILSDFKDSAEQINTPPKTGFRIGIPNEMPEHIVSTLKGFLNDNGLVNDIFFGIYEQNMQLSYVAAIDLKNPIDEKSFQQLVNDVGLSIRGINLQHPLDITLLEGPFKGAAESGHLLSVQREQC